MAYEVEVTDEWLAWFRDLTEEDRWYETHVPKADDLYDEHLKILRREGLI